MSKVALKKYLGTLEKSEVIDVVLGLYDARKEAKEYLEYFLNPDEKAKLKEYKAIIRNEFWPKRGDGKCQFSVCKKAIADFRKLHPSPKAVIFSDFCCTFAMSLMIFAWQASNL